VTASDRDLSLPIHQPPRSEQPGSPSAWELEQEPTTLVIFWPGDQPTQTETLGLLASAVGQPLDKLDEFPTEDPEAIWNVGLELPDHTALIVWCERARAMPPGELGDASAEQCRWVIGMTAILDWEDPVRSYGRLLRLIHAAFAHSPGVLDVNTTQYRPRAQLGELMRAEDVDPPAQWLWTIHGVWADQPTTTEPTVWLHTHGLWRCGRPELEMLEVPRSQATAAADLINDLGEILLDQAPPQPGEPMPLGQGVSVTLHPWQSIVAELSPESCGGADARRGEMAEAHTGVRAVICGGQPRGTYRALWAWPKDEIAKLENDEAVIECSPRALLRRERLAQATFGDLATAFAAAAGLVNNTDPAQRMFFAIKAGLKVPNAQSQDACEHLWFMATAFDGQRVRGSLLNTPIRISMREREELWLTRQQVSDWQVLCRMGTFKPDSIAALWHAIDTLRSPRP
jgi:uncharacterized protein YegJ (DUF2314 family)